MRTRWTRSLSIGALLTAGAAFGQTTPLPNVGPVGGLDDAVARYAFTYPTADGSDITLYPDVMSPSTFLGYPIGTRFTRHADIVRYADYLATVSDRVAVERYGRSHQGRELIIVTISSPANIRDLEGILERNRELTAPAETSASRAREIARTNPVIQWLSFGVHGNEASVGEAAIQSMYTLAAGGDAVEAWLDDCIVVIDPNLNPDGRERYISHYENAVGVRVDDTPISREHEEPWPGGRSNHYMFDLNRDWVWGTQVESASRLKVYRRYMPHGHIDAHEQGYNSPFFLGAGDAPYSLNIPPSTRDWIEAYGTASADVFDRLGLPYASRERFDYLYPGYGKVLPTYHGAVSLLTEQAGHGRGGLAIRVSDYGGPEGDGYVLTLRERTRNHWLVSMSYVEVAANNRQAQLERFYNYFKDAADGAQEPGVDTGVTAFVLANDNPYAAGALQRIARLLDMHGVEYTALNDPITLEAGRAGADVTWLEPMVGSTEDGWWIEDDLAQPVTIPQGSMVVRTNQPLGRLVRTLFERSPGIEEIETYDITAWSTAVMHGVRSYAWRGPSDMLDGPAWQPPTTHTPVNPGDLENAVALLVDSSTLNFPTVLDAAAEHQILARLVGTLDGPVQLPGAQGSDAFQTFAPGSLLVHINRNEPAALRRFVNRVNELGAHAGVVTAGAPLAREIGGTFVGSGPALGNNANRRFVLPKVALVGGDGVSSLSFGHNWHMLDYTWGVNHIRVNTDRVGSILDHVNVVILPERWGSWSGADDMARFVREGGTVIALGRSADWATRELIGLDDAENTALEGVDRDERDAATGADNVYQLDQEERRARADELRVPGAMLLAHLDTTHRLSAGVPDNLGFHVFNGTPLAVADNGTVLARFADIPDMVIGGHIGELNRERLAASPAVTLHRLGGGRVICFASDPTNRGMNIAGMRLLMNAIMLGPSEPGSLQPLGPGADLDR